MWPSGSGRRTVFATADRSMPFRTPPSLRGRGGVGLDLLDIPSRHKGRREKGKHQLAALIGADGAGLNDAPFGTFVRYTQRFHLARVADGVAGQHRLYPAQFAKTRRGSPYRG